ncbi:MAG TPA: hypothetical protein VIP09_04380 [Dehalococcoidia bacterium]|jgi:hypothetical protein
MTLLVSLDELRQTVLDELARAAKSGDAQRIVSLARALEQIERDYRLAADIEGRLIRITEDLRSTTPIAPVVGDAPIATESAKARGIRIQKEFATRHDLIQVKGQEYRTKQGLRVGVATATEDKRRNGRWFLGLPGKEYDIAVLICDHDGRLLEFVIPVSDLASDWRRLSRDKKGHFKFNIRRHGGTYGDYQLVIPSTTPVDIQQFMGVFGPLA